MKKDYDKTLTRLITTLTKISNNERPDTKELAIEFNVSVRTIQKDIKDRLRDFPIEKDENGKFKFEDGFSLDKTFLEHKEAMFVALAVSQFENVRDINRIKDNVISKITTPGFYNPYFIKHNALENLETNSPLTKILENSIKHRNVLLLDLRHKKVEVEPYKIANFDGFWYLFGKELEDNKVKTYMLKNIYKATVLDKHFQTSTEQIEQVLNHVHSAWFDDGEAYTVKIQVEPEVAHYFKNKEFLQSQEITKEYSDGSLEILFEITHFEDIDNIIKAWLPHVKVLEPLEYKEAIRKELEDYLKNYD